MQSETVELVGRGLKRIFSMKVSRSTYREVQNVIIAATQGDSDQSDKLFKSLVTAEVPSDLAKGDAEKKLKALAEDYAIPIRLAKDVLERGEFVNLLTSDTLNNENSILFLNRVRRIDGEEFQFITDPSSTAHLLQHFVGRMSELNKTDAGKGSLKAITKELEAVKAGLEQLIKSAK